MDQTPEEVDGKISGDMPDASSVKQIPVKSAFPTASTTTLPAKRPRGRPPLSGRNSKAHVSGRSWPEKDLKPPPPKVTTPSKPIPQSLVVSSQPLQISLPAAIPKIKMGAALRTGTYNILSRLLTEDPLPLAALQGDSECVQDLSVEQVQDILDVLQVMGLVITVRPKRKRSRTLSESKSPSIPIQPAGHGTDNTAAADNGLASIPTVNAIASCDINSSGDGNSSSTVNGPSVRKASHASPAGGSTTPQKTSYKSQTDNSDILYTMKGFARGQEPPEEMWSICADTAVRRKRASAIKRRADELEQLVNSLPAQLAEDASEDDLLARENEVLDMFISHLEQKTTEEEQKDALYRAITDAILSIQSPEI